MIAWTSYSQDGSGAGIFAQRFDSRGSRVGPEFQVNTWVANDQVAPSIVMTPEGTFLIVWSSMGQGVFMGVFAQSFDRNGAKVGGEISLTDIPGSHSHIHAAANPAGDMVVVWNHSSQYILARVLDRLGQPRGPEVEVGRGVGTFEEVAAPDVGILEDGSFIVVWQREDHSIPESRIHARRFDRDGNPLGSEIVLGEEATLPDITVTYAGNYTITWSSVDDDKNGVVARVYLCDSFVRGDVNRDGQLDIGDAQHLLNYLFASGPEPDCLDAGDTDDNGVFTIGDAVRLLDYLFANGQPPARPFRQPGPDPTRDRLSCGWVN